MLKQYDVFNSWEWDVVVVLDACRYDYFCKYAYPVIGGRLFKAWSSGSCTPEWFVNTFDKDWYDVIYVSGNAFISSEPVPAEGFGKIHAGAKFRKVVDAHKIAWQKVNGVYTVRPDILCNLAIQVLRFNPDARVIVHFLQPHAPYVFKPELSKYWDRNKRRVCGSLWDALRRGEVDVETVKDGYVKNIEWVVKSVTKLLNHASGMTVVVTADHGEMFGEDGLYNHPPRCSHPLLRQVPVAYLTL